MADYENSMQPVDFSFDLRKNRDWVELENDIAKNVRELARKQRIPSRNCLMNYSKNGWRHYNKLELLNVCLVKSVIPCL